ncbi:hypothetical protein D5F01_LYC21365 [Larimichthys crocea]|uniref:Uncharacterized protein n=1 Tax=Larimichthys crocea TaxID=215358 RepID=A0A6G0HP66_LARCR|nr:hypothetical protein D5F01_LYC21365 [Larimichthys crocea]
MPAFSPPASFLCVLLCVSVALQRSDLRLAYVTHNSFFYYSCSQDPQPCSVASLADCRCKDIQLSTLHRPQSHSSPVFRMRRLTVWFTSPLNTARLLNNSERPVPQCPDGSKAKNTDSNIDPDRDNAAHVDRNRYNKDRGSNLDLIVDMKKDSSALPSPQIQDILLGRELGAAYHEQARLGIIHSSVLEWGAVVKAYTVQTHIDNDGMLPFPDLHLPKLPETSVIYVSFVY